MRGGSTSPRVLLGSMSGKAHTAVHDVMKYNSSHEKTNF